MKKWIAFAFAIIAALLLLFWPDAPQKKYYHNQGRIFGTYYNIRYEASEDLHKWVQARFQQVNNSLNMFIPTSTISRINNNDTAHLNLMFITLFNEAQTISQLSDGAFDITVAPMVNAWGFGTNNQGPKPKTEDINIDSLKALVGYTKLQLIDSSYVQKDDPRITMDASAIAKGFTCDIVADLLRKMGCENLLVDIGGEVVAQGVNEKGQPWRVGISKPKNDASGMEDELQEIIASSNLCMATSGNYLQYYYAGSQRRSHTIDPRTGYPVEHSLLSATVTASTCMRADALATACMVLGEKEALNMIECIPDAACYLIVAQADSLQVITSSRWLN